MKFRKPRVAPTLRLGGLSVRSFFRSRLTIAALVSLTVIPLLYSGLYLWSFWDPFDRMSNLPVALVNDDRPVQAGGAEINAGAEITEELLDGGDLDWHLVDAAEAASGVAEGRYYVSLTIPGDFSERLSSPEDEDTEAVPAMLEAQYNDANGYIVRQLMSSAFTEVRTAAGSSAVADYLDKMFLGFNEVQEATAAAADGAGQLAGGAGTAQDGSAELTDGLSEAVHGSSGLSAGLGALYAGSQELAAGASTAAQEVSQAVDKLNPLAEEWIPVVRDHAPQIEHWAQTIAQLARALSDALDQLPAPPAAEHARGLSDRIGAYLDERPGLAQDDPQLYALLNDAADTAVGTADQAAHLPGLVQHHREDLDTIREKAERVAELASGLADAAPHLADDLAGMQSRINELDNGLAELADGSVALRNGLRDAASGADDLAEGIGLLRNGSAELHAGLGELQDGSQELSDGLTQGVEDIPAFSDEDRAARGDMMSDPVRLSSATANPAPDYGTGFAPFFIALSLWVGAMMVFMVLSAVSTRGLASTAPSWRITLAGWIPALLIGVAQVGISLVALHFLLGLEVAHWAGALGLLVLAVAAYTAIVQWANVQFGTSGRVVALILLMLQLTSAGGTYPIETSPEFFQALSPYLPMSWVVSALRILISGGDIGVVWSACGVLTAYLVVFLLLTWFAVTRKRMWTMADLRPVLQL